MKAKKQYSYDPDHAVFPGETVKEVMESLGMTQAKFAKRLDISVMTLNRIFRGIQPITHETANRLEMVTRTPARFWNNLEANYQERKAKLHERECLQRDLGWLKIMPTKELIERGMLEPGQDEVELLHNTLQFYGVGSVHAWNEIWKDAEVAARRSHCFETAPGPASAWLRQGELKAQQISCDEFDKACFRNVLKQIRTLTRTSPDMFCKKLISLCASCGVAVSLVKEMKKVPWNGATRWLTPNKAMILLSLRGKGEDKFWFSFFHEAAHVLNDGKKELYIADNSDDPKEIAANEFAAEILIPSKYNPQITGLTSKKQLRDLATEIGISPGIVAGRYQHLTGKWDWFRDQIRKFDWKK